MSDDNLTLLEQAKAHAREQGRLSVGASTPDGRSGEAHIGLSGGWKRLTAAIYAKVLLVRGKKADVSASVEVTKEW